jgi:hypothetical protein
MQTVTVSRIFLWSEHMVGTSSTRGTARLRLLLAELIAENFKAYDLPMLGERLGLLPGLRPRP